MQATTDWKKKPESLKGFSSFYEVMLMEISVLKQPAKPGAASVNLLFEGDRAEGVQFSKEDFSAKPGEACIIRNSGVSILVGLGKKADFEDERIRQAAGAFVYASKKTSAKSFVVQLPAFEKADDFVASRNFAEGAILASYEFSKYKERKAEDKASLEGKEVLLKPAKSVQRAEDGLRIGKVMAQAANYARDLNNEPGNVANPEYMAHKAIALAKKHGLSCKVINTTELAKMGLHGIAYVGAGSDVPGRMVVLEYSSAAKAHSKDPFVFIGKGITFDSGGISIKQIRGLELMKWDKAGACAVLGVMKAAAELAPNARVVGILALAESMPSSSAFRPGDILKTGGTSIEVITTHAEGRLVVADALSYAKDKFPDARSVVAVASISGACVVALGSVASGLLSPDDGLSKELEQASYRTGERVWRLPMFPEYAGNVEGRQADLRNSSEPSGEAGTITAAFFLKRFAGKWPWAYIDIAGTGWQTTQAVRNYYCWGPTGAGTRLCMQYLLDKSGK